jgi:hypothetical protein
VTVSNVAVTNDSYTVLDDTPYISTAGGFIRVIGTGFASGCVVYVGGTPATSTTFVSSTEVRAVIPATSSNTLMVYVVNPDGSTAIKLNSLIFSGTPAWSTAETLSGQISDVAFSIQLSATSNSSITYSLAAGSSLPPGTALSSGGVFSGTVTGLSGDTTYSFSVVANDAENQDTSRTFSVTVSVGDSGFYLTPMLVNGDANVWIRDSSVNNLLPAINGTTIKPTAFSPYNTSWSVLLSSVSDYLTVPAGTDFAYGTGDFTVDGWVYPTAIATFGSIVWSQTTAGTNYFVVSVNPSRSIAFTGTNSGGGTEITGPANSLVTLNAWNHFAVTRTSGSVRVYVNGLGGTATSNTTDFTNVSYVPTIGRYTHQGTDVFYTGYISNLRVVKGVAAFTGNFTVPTTLSTVTQSAGTNINAITVGQTVFLGLQNYRFNDANTTPKTITLVGTAQAKSFGPFVDTDITTGSSYFLTASADHLIYSTTTALGLSNGNWTIDFWVYPTTTTRQDWVDINGSGTRLLIYYNGTAITVFGNSVGLITGSAITQFLYQWNHILVSNLSGSTRLWVNGIQQGSTYSNSQNYGATNGLSVGKDSIGSANMTGYIADLRIIKGSGVSTPTVPTTPLTAITDTSLLTLQYRTGENSIRFVDESGRKSLINRTGDPYQGSFSPFSPARWSAYFDGTGDYLDLTGSANLAFGTGDWTIELWIYFNSVTGDQIIYDSRPASTNGAYPTIYRSTTTIRYYTDTGERIASSTITTNTWYHVVVSRVSGTTRMFVNGTVQAQTYTDSITYLNGASRPRIGDSGVTVGAGFSGYISNLRVLTGTGYTSVTVPTSVLTAIANTQLLTLQDNRFKDNSTNAFAITRSGDARIEAFSPFKGSGEYSPTTHGGSAYFDGSGDYITVVNSPLITLGTSDHTVEFWMYPNGTQGNYGVVWEYSATSSQQATNDYYFGINNVGTAITLLLGASGSWAVNITLSSGEYAAALNRWNHVVITRSGTAFRLFLDGVLKGYATSSQSIGVQVGGMAIGQDTTGNGFKGYVSNFNMTVGSIPAAYQTASTTTGTAIFTPPTAPSAITANTVVCTNFTNSGLVDLTARNLLYTVGTVKIRGNITKFGIGSFFFDTSYGYVLITPAVPLLPTIGDYTVECWVYATNDSTLMCINTNLSVHAACRLSVNADGSVGYLVSTAVTVNAINTTTGAGTFSFNTWQHIAVVRNGGTHSVYINGTSRIASTTITATTAVQAGVESVLGAIDNRNNSDFASFYGGYIDELRITRYARYTANFTAPTTEFLTR